MTATALDTPPRALYRVPEVMQLLSLSRTVIYELIRSGRLRTVQQGRIRLDPRRRHRRVRRAARAREPGEERPDGDQGAAAPAAKEASTGTRSGSASSPPSRSATPRPASASCRRGSGKTETAARAKLQGGDPRVRGGPDRQGPQPDRAARGRGLARLRPARAGAANGRQVSTSSAGPTSSRHWAHASCASSRATDVDRWLAEKAKTLSTRTLRELHQCLNRSINRAMARDKVERNVVALCGVPARPAGRPSKSLRLRPGQGAAPRGRGHAVCTPTSSCRC